MLWETQSLKFQWRDNTVDQVTLVNIKFVEMALSVWHLAKFKFGDLNA